MRTDYETLSLVNIEEAIQLYDRALALEPENVDILANKGIALNSAQRYDEAMELFDKGLELNSEHVECLYNKGVSLEGLGRASEASEYKERATAIDPNYTGEFQIHSK